VYDRIPESAERLVVLLAAAGPQIRTVVSSDALAIMSGSRGFQWTQLTVRVCPSSVTSGCSCLMCHTYTLLSNNDHAQALLARDNMHRNKHCPRWDERQLTCEPPNFRPRSPSLSSRWTNNLNHISSRESGGSF